MLTAKKTPLLKFGMAALALAVMAVLNVGCSQNAPNAPNTGVDGLKALAHIEDQYGPDPLTAGGSEGGQASGVLGVLRSFDGNSAVIGPAGGVLNLTFGETTSRFAVPARALTEAVRISAVGALFHTPWGDIAMYDFSPDGLKFIRPATLTLSNVYSPGELAKLYWFNPRTGRWQLEQVGRPDRNGNVTFLIFHFSKYAIS
jgi:hypothetical protein